MLSLLWIQMSCSWRRERETLASCSIVAQSFPTNKSRKKKTRAISLVLFFCPSRYLPFLLLLSLTFGRHRHACDMHSAPRFIFWHIFKGCAHLNIVQQRKLLLLLFMPCQHNERPWLSLQQQLSLLGRNNTTHTSRVWRSSHSWSLDNIDHKRPTALCSSSSSFCSLFFLSKHSSGSLSDACFCSSPFVSLVPFFPQQIWCRREKLRTGSPADKVDRNRTRCARACNAFKRLFFFVFYWFTYSTIWHCFVLGNGGYWEE